MRITIKDTAPDRVGVIGHESDIEPIMVTLTAEERAKIAESPGDGLLTVTFFPPTMSEEDRSAFMGDCASAPA